MKFFKPEDFIVHTYKDAFKNQSTLMAKMANDKLEREGNLVYSNSDGLLTSTKQFNQSTHKALLINIEPIEECKHEKEKVRKKWDVSTQHPLFWHECECGARVEPKTYGVIE